MSKVAVLENYYRANHQRLVDNYARRCGNPADAEDVVQEAFTKALTYIDRYSTSEPFSNWMTRIVYNTFCDWKKEQRAGFSCVSFNDEHYDPIEGNEEKKALVAKVRAYIDGYDDASKEIINLFYFCNYKAREIADICGVPIGLVLKTLYQFRNLMKEIV